MYLEKSYSGGGPQLALVDDAGKKHDVCALLAQLCPEVTCNADSDTGNQRPEGDQSSLQETGAETGEETDPQGSQSGGEGDGGGAEETGTVGQDKKPAKASKGKSRKKKA